MNAEDHALRSRAEGVGDRFFELSLDMLCVATFDGYFVRLNPAWKETLGYTLEDLASKPYLEFVHPEDRPATLKEMESLTTGAPTVSFENRYRTKEGTYRWISWSVAPDVQAGLVYAVARDVTERKEAEEALQGANERMANTLESVTDAFYALDRNWCFTYLNREAERVLQRPKEELLGRNVWDEFPEAVDTILNAEYHEALATGTTANFEFYYEPLEAWIDVRAYPSHEGLSVYLQDVSDRKRIEEVRKESEQRLQALSDAAFEAIIITEGGALLEANRAYFAMYGYEPEELLGKSAEKTVAPESRELVRKRMLSGYEGTYEAVGLRKDGERIEMEVRSRAAIYRGREVRINALQNVTERKGAEESLNQLNEELERRNLELNHKNREIEAFVYSISHDLRSPLVNLEGFSQELGLVGEDIREIFKNSDLPPETRQRGLELIDEDMETSIHFIRTGVKRLSDIIDALLRLSRAGRVEYRWQRVDLNPVIGRVLDAMKDTSAKSEADVTVGDLPPVWGDPTQLEQVFANLISNALNYLDPARPGHIEVGCKEIEGVSDDCSNLSSLTYYVRDNGVGISEQALDKVFQVFQRLHPEKAAGEGLGLTVVQRIVERHGGRIWVESTEREGSTFFVRLPNNREDRPS